jgi:hypothetical protein
LNTGAIYEARLADSVTERQVRVHIEDRPGYPRVTAGREQAVFIRGTTWYYDRSTGNFSGTNTPQLRMFNPSAIEPVALPLPVVPAPEPTVVLEEVFARFRNGQARGPFTTEEEARETYPRVRSFFTRRVLSDGSTTFEDL